MRKLMMTTLVLLLAVTIVVAQPGKGKRGQKQPDLYSQLDLTAEQQEQIKTIKTEARAKAKASMQQEQEKRPDRSAMKQLREESRQAIEAVLTVEQKEKLAKLAAERKAAWESVDKKALKQEMKTHREEEVIPVIKAARGQLDQFISAEDQQAIVRLREVFKTQRLTNQRGQKKAKSKGQRPTSEQKESIKAERETWREAHSAEIAELKALTTKYQEDLKRIQTRLQPQMEAWNKEKKEIVRAHLPEDAPQKAAHDRTRGPKKGRAQQRHDEGADKKSVRGGERGGWPKAAAFLLMEG
ncbi:MAG: Spy/CpxP family protein refolding chaperone [Lewinella sp.]